MQIALGRLEIAVTQKALQFMHRQTIFQLMSGKPSSS